MLAGFSTMLMHVMTYI